ncbi:hypothetical protein HDV57DRAFT_508434 [Trichoderma longibrachiatum]
MPFPKPVAVQGGWQVKESPATEQANPIDVRSIPRSAAGVVTDSGDILDRSGKAIGKIQQSEDSNDLVGNAVTAAGDILDSSGNVLAKATLNTGDEGEEGDEEEAESRQEEEGEHDDDQEEEGDYTTESSAKDQKSGGWNLMGKGKSAYQTASNLQKPVSQGLDLVSRMQKPSEEEQSSTTDSTIQMSQGDRQPQEEVEGQAKEGQEEAEEQGKELEKSADKEPEAPISMEDKSEEAQDKEQDIKDQGEDKLQEEVPQPMDEEAPKEGETTGDVLEKPDEAEAGEEEGEKPDEEQQELTQEEKDKQQEEELDFSELKGCKVNKAGNLVNKNGDIIGRLIEGDAKKLLGKRADDKGQIWDDSGNVIGKAEPLSHSERGDEKDFAPFENFPDATVDADGRVMHDGKQVGVVVEGDPKRLKGSHVDEDGDILDRRGNVIGKAEAWDEPEAEPEAVVDKSSLAGKRVNKAGNVVDGSGAIWGRVVEGNIKALVGRMCDKQGNVLSESGDIIGKAELVSEGEREGMKEGPFAELSGCTVAKDGKVVTPSGDVVGRLVEGDPKKLFGRSVDEDGDVVDSNGNVLGKAERWQEEEVERKKAPYAGRKVNRDGNVVDEEGNIIAKLEVDDDGDVVNYKGQAVGHTEEDMKKKEEAERDRQLAQKLAVCIEQSLDKIRPICKMITDKINTAERTPKEELDEEQLVREILTETNGTIRGLDPDGRIQRNAKHKAGTKEASPEEYHLADVLKELTGTITQTIDNAKSKIEGMPHAKKELNPLWGLLAEPLFQIIAAVGLLLNGVLGLVGKLLSGLGLGGLVDNLLGTLGLNKVLDSLGLGSITVTMAKVIFLMADYGHDPTETCGPYTAFKAAGFNVSFATEAGKSPQCDMKMLEGLTQRLLGASSSIVKQYRVMAESEEWKNPLSWSDEQFSLDAFNLVFLPGGHDKAVRQIIDSDRVHKLLADYFPKTKKPSNKAVGAVCHGVMVLSESKHPDGSSVIRDCVTTALPARFEQVAFWGTRLFLGDYYKTYGAGSENVEDSLTVPIYRTPANIVSLSFVVEDDNYNYVTARFPGDVELLSQKLVKLVQSF